MQIIKKDRPEQVIEVGDLVTEPDSDVACLVGGELIASQCRPPSVPTHLGSTCLLGAYG